MGRDEEAISDYVDVVGMAYCPIDVEDRERYVLFLVPFRGPSPSACHNWLVKHDT